MTRAETYREFTCANCEQSWTATNTEQDATIEMLDTFGEVIPKDDCISVCDDCYPVLMAAAREAGLL